MPGIKSDFDRDSIVVMTGKRMGATPTPNLLRALEQLQDRLGLPEAVGSPRVGGIAETLYVRTKQGSMLFDISSSEEPRVIHVYEKPAWYEGSRSGGLSWPSTTPAWTWSSYTPPP